MNSTTVVEAKNNLPKLIHAAEAGRDIHISRHGKPVAVLVSAVRYQQLSASGKGVFAAIMQWRDATGGLDGLTDAEIARWRDASPGREFSWD